MFLANVICLDMTLFHDYPQCLPYGIYLLPLISWKAIQMFKLIKCQSRNEAAAIKIIFTV